MSCLHGISHLVLGGLRGLLGLIHSVEKKLVENKSLAKVGTREALKLRSIDKHSKTVLNSTTIHSKSEVNIEFKDECDRFLLGTYIISK